MRLEYTTSELLEKLEETGYSVYWFEVNNNTESYITIDTVNDNTFYTDNKTQMYVINLQITFYTKNSGEKFNINKFMKNNFNCNLTTSYADDNDYFLSTYDVQLKIKSF